MHLTFKTNHLTYLSRTFTISKKKKENISNLKNFRRFRGFALHYESAESAENWQDLVLILGNRLDYFLSELKLILNLQKQQKIESWQLFDWKITIEITVARIDRDCLVLVATRNNENLSNFRNFSQIDGKLRKQKGWFVISQSWKWFCCLWNQIKL